MRGVGGLIENRDTSSQPGDQATMARSHFLAGLRPLGKEKMESCIQGVKCYKVNLLLAELK